MSEGKVVWVFHGVEGRLTSAVFSTRRMGEAWIRKHKLTGMLTAYPLDVGVYDWAVKRGDFTLKSAREGSSEFIGAFTWATALPR